MSARKHFGNNTALWMLLTLAAFFLIGIFLGQVAAGFVPVESQTELKRYLDDYIMMGQSGGSPEEVFLRTLVLYFRYPAAAFLLGFASVGSFLLPCLSVFLGMGLSFSVSCFFAAFGTEGILFACALFGVRTLVTLPIFFISAVPAWLASCRLFALTFGRGHRKAVLYDRAFWTRFFISAAGLFAGACADFCLTPRVLEQVLI